VAPAGVTHYVHDIFGNVIAETAGGGATGATGTVREYIWLYETEIAPTMGSRTTVDRPLAVVDAVNTASPAPWPAGVGPHQTKVSVDHPREKPEGKPKPPVRAEHGKQRSRCRTAQRPPCGPLSGSLFGWPASGRTGAAQPTPPHRLAQTARLTL